MSASDPRRQKFELIVPFPGFATSVSYGLRTRLSLVSKHSGSHHFAVLFITRNSQSSKATAFGEPLSERETFAHTLACHDTKSQLQ
jgi:hypothetical protein